MRPPRFLALATLLTGAALVLVTASPAAACACGGMAPPSGSDVSVGDEHAIVSWNDGVEQIDLLLGVFSEETDAGLVFPTPSPATVSLGSLEDFEAIDRVTEPTIVEDYDWWSAPRGLGDSAGAPPEVLDRVQLGPIEAVTLAASDADGLVTWLADNDFELAPAVEALLESYVERGWYFVALRLDGEAPLDGDLDPLRFTFESDTLVYPLELSQAATQPQTVRLYVFDEHRQDVTFIGAEAPGSTTSWAAPVTGTEVEHFGEYLTVIELYFSDPASQIVGDLEFSDAASDETVGTEDHITVELGIAGIPLGWLLVGVATLGVVAAILVIVRVRAKRA